MKDLFLFLFAFILINPAKAQTKTSNNIAGVPFQGTKQFCSFTGKSRYIVLIKGSRANLTYSYKEYKTTVSGSFKNGKLYTNDPYEKDSKTGGRYYLISKTLVRVLNTENGDYEDYTICK